MFPDFYVVGTLHNVALKPCKLLYSLTTYY